MSAGSTRAPLFGPEHFRLAGGELTMPAPVNAHDHGYGIRTLDFGGVDDALEPWIASLRLRPATDPYCEAVVAFGRLALGGVAGTVHCHNSLLAERLVEEAGEVVRAARDVGIRLALSCPLLDANAWVYGGPNALRAYLAEDEWQALRGHVPSYAPLAEQLAAADAVAHAHAGGGVDVQYGPIGPQWCSRALLEAIAEASRANDRRIHMHLLESPRQRTWLDREYPQGIVPFLDSIGFLSPRLALAHGVHLRGEEIELLAARGVTLVSNPAANLRLRSGIAPLGEWLRAGLAFAFGLDGTGFDDDQDLWRELRLAYLLHGGQGLVRTLSAAQVFDAAIANGARVLGQPGGADTVGIDYAALSEDMLFDDLDPREVLLTRMTRAHVRHLSVGGREVVRDGRLTGCDFDAARRELRAQARADLPRLEQARATAVRLAAAIRRFYASSS